MSALMDQVIEPDHLCSSSLTKGELKQMCTQMFIVFKHDLHLQFHDLNYLHMVPVNRKNLFVKKVNNHCEFGGGSKMNKFRLFIPLKREQTCCWP